MSDERRVRFRGREQGTYSIEELYRMGHRGVFDHTAEFFSERSHQWLPMAGILQDLEGTPTTEERIKVMKEAGIRKVGFVSGDAEVDCPSCRAIAQKIYPIDDVPKVPPSDCSCVPWCALCVVGRLENGADQPIESSEAGGGAPL